MIINLPKPSNQLTSLVKEVVKARPINYQSQHWHKKINPYPINCAAGEFFAEQQVSILAISEYQKFFSERLNPIIGIMHNTESTPASYPPHSDRIRFVGINYYIELGGKDVKTVFYDKVDSDNDLIGGHVLSYDNVPKITHTECFDSGSWYVLSSRQYHSVENIQTSRCVLSLCLQGIKLSKFVADYSNMLAGEMGFEPMMTISKTVALDQTRRFPNN